MKELAKILEKIEELRDLAHKNLVREDRPHEVENKIRYYWHRLNSKEVDYIQKMLIDRSIELRMDQDKNVQEIFFVDDLFDKFN
jgi:hypothetical protein